MAQFLRPISDISVGNWTGSYTDIDEVTENLSDSIISSDNSGGDTFECGLNGGDDPLVSTGHIIRVTWRKPSSGGHVINATLNLMQGTTTIATRTVNDITGSTYERSVFTLSGAEADAITDYGDLRLQFVRNGDTGGNPSGRRSLQVFWAEMELPNPTSQLTGTIGCGSYLGTDLTTGYSADATKRYAPDTDSVGSWTLTSGSVVNSVQGGPYGNYHLEISQITAAGRIDLNLGTLTAGTPYTIKFAGSSYDGAFQQSYYQIVGEGFYTYTASVLWEERELVFTPPTTQAYTFRFGSNVAGSSTISYLDGFAVILGPDLTEAVGSTLQLTGSVNTSSAVAGSVVTSETLTGSSGGSSTVAGSHLFDEDAKALIDAVEGATTMSVSDKNAVDKLARSLKTNNLWSKLITLYPMVGSVYDSQKWNMKDPQDTDAAHRLVTLTEGTGTQSNSVDGWQFTADNNAGNGAYLHGFLKSSDIQPTNGQRFAVGQFFYINSDMGSDPNGGFMAGWWNGNGDTVLQFRPYAAIHPNTYIKYNITSAIQVPKPAGSGEGFYAMFTENANSAKAWYNGSVLGSSTNAVNTYDNTLDRIFPIHGLHNNAELVTPIASHFYDPDGHTARHAFAAQSNADWSEAEVTTMQSIVEEYVTDIGRFVSPVTSLTGSISGSSTMSGALSSAETLSGSVSGSSITVGGLTETASLSGSASGSSVTNNAVLKKVTSMTASAGGSSVTSGGLTFASVTRALSGALSTVSSLAASLVLTAGLSGSVSAASTTAGDLTIGANTLQVTGSVAGTSVCAADISVQGELNVAVSVSASSDDYEELMDGTRHTSSSITSSDLELGYCLDAPGGQQRVGMRFLNVGIPKNAKITGAYIQFKVDENKTAVSPELEIKGQVGTAPATFVWEDNNMLNRPKTTAVVSWDNIPEWIVPDQGPDQRTPSIASILQEIVNDSNYVANDPIAIFIESIGVGTADRTAESFDGTSGAPQINVWYLNPVEQLTASLSSNSVVSGDVVSIESIGGSVSTNSSVGGELVVNSKLSGSLSASSVLTGALDFASIVLQLTGSLGGGSAVTGDIVQGSALAGSLSTSSSVSGGLNVLAQLGGSLNTGSVTSGGLSSNQYDADAQAFIDAVEGGGDTLSQTEKDAVNSLVVGLKANGTWSKYLAIYPFINSTATAHKWNLKDPRDLDAAFRLTFHGSGTHGVNGYTGRQTSGNDTYARTYFIDTAHYTFSGGQVDALWGYYSPVESTQNAGNAIEMGANIGVGGSMAYMQIDWNNVQADVLWYDSTYHAITVSGVRYYGVIKSVSGQSKYFKNGKQIGTTLTQDQAAGNGDMVLINACGENATGTAVYNSSSSSRTCATAVIGVGAFTDEEVQKDWTVIHQYNVDLGRGVPAEFLTGSVSASSAITNADLTEITGTTLQLSGALAGSSMVAGDLVQTDALSGSVAGSSAVAGDIVQKDGLSGAIAGASSSAGSLTSIEGLGASASGSSVVVGDLIVSNAVDGSLAGSSVVTGDLLLRAALEGNVSGSSAVAGGLDILSVTRALTGTLAGVSVSVGNLVSSETISASVSGSSVVSGVLTSSKTLNGSSVTGSTVVGALDIAGVSVSLTGAITTVSSVSGDLVTSEALSGSEGGSTVVAGDLREQAAIDGSTAGSSAVAGDLSVQSLLSGSAAGGSITTGGLDIAGVSASLTGALNTGSSLTGDLVMTESLSGSEGGSSAVGGDLVTIETLSGSASGGSVVAGNVDFSTGMSGAVGGSSAVAGYLSVGAKIVGAAGGSSVVSGGVVTIEKLTGTAGGSSVLSGAIGTGFELTGTINGSSTVGGEITTIESLSVALAGNSTTIGNLTSSTTVVGSVSTGSVISGNLRIATGGQMVRYWTGTAWAFAQVLKWDGSTWQPAIVKYWDGSQWKNA